MKAYQRIIREQHAAESDPMLEQKLALAASMSDARVCEVSRRDAEKIILKYEWLGNMGTTSHAFGLYFGEYLAGVVCFGSTAGTRTAESICGPQYAHLVRTLNRGACVHWAHPHSASFLINIACRLMAGKGYHIFVAYSDPEAGEIGTVYQAANWFYTGTTKQASSMFRWTGKPSTGFKDGKPRDERNIHHITRIRTVGDGPYRVKCSRREMKRRLVREGFEFFRTSPKHRYVRFAGDKPLVRRLKQAMQLDVLPYPKRA